MSAVHPISRAWVSTGSTGAQNYDEFADEREITGVIQENPHSALAVEMPHRAPGGSATTFSGALPEAAARLTAAQEQARYTPHEQVVAAYRITSPDGAVTLGLFAMVDTGEISTSATEPGLVIRNEDVFVAKVRERVALIEATGHLLSAVLLLQTRAEADLMALLEQACASSGEPEVVDHDPAGRSHEVWVVTDPDLSRRLCELAGAGELVVADGNHRSLAAQHAGLERFLAVITTPSALSLRPYHRLLTEWPESAGPIEHALAGVGAQVDPLPGPVPTPTASGTVHLYTLRGGYAVRIPSETGSPHPSGVCAMDHARLEQVLLGQVLGWAPEDPRITYVGGDYSAPWLCAAVDQGRATVAVLVAPVTVEQFVAVNVQRSAMPHKSTWFTPKARAGLVLAQLR